VAQAEACGLEPRPDFNPILLKPTTDMGSQVVLNGKVWGNLTAREYYDNFEFLLRNVLDAYERLSREFECIVIEGAGSVAELNLRDRDLVNFGLATRIQSPALLVGDIDRGGIFAAIAGTCCLIEPEERKLIRSFAVNRFRGDPTLFEDGVRILEQRTSLPCLGVFPMARDFSIDEEDGVYLESDLPAAPAPSRVAILRFPRISNFTDFQLMPWARWITQPADSRFDVVILPGTKSTVGDLKWMRSRGLDRWVQDQHRTGARIIGICGGYQMLGETIEDPDGVESSDGVVEGLGLIPTRTVMQSDKTTRAVNAVTASGIPFRAYEIHMGATRAAGEPFAVLEDGTPEGIRSGTCVGTYLHGATEDAAVLSELLGCAIAPAPPKDIAYGKLGEWFRSNANVRLFEELYL
jgi:adenosylcobyric acid synthase